jgi:hypothetical protein
MARRPKHDEDDNFYEAIGAAPSMGTWAVPEDSDDIDEPVAELSDRNQLTIDDTKTTAIVTLILTAVVAIGLVLLFIRGLELIKGATPQPPTTTNLSL